MRFTSVSCFTNVRFCLLIACLVGAFTSGARAADWYTGSSAAKPDDSWLVTSDVSTTYTSNSSLFADAIATAAVNGNMRQSGLRVRAEALAGTYDYKSPGTAAPVFGRQEQASVMAGYEVVWTDASLAGYAGFDVRDNRLSIADPSNPVVGTAYGLKTALDFYANPTPDTMASVYASYATDREAYYARLRGGYAVYRNVFLGPELTLLGDQFFNQWRLGAHLSGWRWGPVQFSLSAGYVHDRIQKSGIYTSLDARVAF